MTRTTIATAVAAAAVAAITLLPSASAQNQPRTLTLKELERGATFKHVRNTRGGSSRANALGDLIVFTNPLTDAAGKRLGRLHASCTTTVGARSFTRSTMTCHGIYALTDGTLTVQAITSPGARTTTGAVTGGTGAYAGARGTIVSTAARTGADSTITLMG